MWKAIAWAFSFDRSSSNNIELLVPGVTLCDILAPVTCPIQAFAQRIPSLGLDSRTRSSSTTKRRVMSGLTSRFGIGSRPSTFLSAVDILRRTQAATSHSKTEASLTDEGDTDGVPSRASSLHQPVVIEDTQSEAASTEFNIREDCLEALSITRLPCLLPPCQVPDILELFAKAEPKYDEKAWGLITMRDAKRSEPWRSTEASPSSEEHPVTHIEPGHVAPPQDSGYSQPVSNDDISDDLPSDEDELHGLVTVNISAEQNNRVISVNSTSDTSTRLSSIWDQNRLDTEGSDGDDWDLTDLSNFEDHGDIYRAEYKSEPTYEQSESSRSSPSFEEDLQANEPDEAQSHSPDPDEPPTIPLPTLQRAGVTMIRSPKRRRSSNPAVLPLEAENEHLLKETTSLQEQLSQARAGIAELKRHNVGLSSALEQHDSHLPEVHDLLDSYEQLQAKNKDLRSKNVALQDDNDCLKHENRRFQRDYITIKTRNARLLSHHNQTRKVLDEVHDFIFKQHRQVKGLGVEAKSAKHELAQQTVEKEAVEGELLATQRDLKTTIAELAASQAKFTKNQSVLALTETQLAATHHQLSSVQRDLDTTLLDLPSRREELTATQYEVTTTQRKLTAAENELLSTRDVLTTALLNLLTTQRQLRDTEDHLKTTKRILETNEVHLITANETIHTQDRRFSSVGEHIHFLEGWIDSLHEQRTALYEAKSVKAETTETKSVRAATVEEGKEEAAEEGVRAETMENVEEVKEVEEVREMRSSHGTVKRRYETLEQIYGTLEQKYEGLEREYKKLKRNHEVLGTVIERVSEKEEIRRAREECQLEFDLEGVVDGLGELTIES